MPKFVTGSRQARRAPNCINGRPQRPDQGSSQGRTRSQRQSAFHELVVLPTFAPQLARPYRVPGTDRWYNLEFLQEEPKGTFLFLSQTCANVLVVAATTTDREKPNGQ
jgi:hypothetical protein